MSSSNAHAQEPDDSANEFQVSATRQFAGSNGREDTSPVERRLPGRRRVRLILSIAVLGFLSAVIAALGPAHAQTTTYTWPSSAATGVDPMAGGVLLLARHHPAQLSLSMPCDGTRAPGIWFKTAWSPDDVGGLSISGDESGSAFNVGPQRIATLPVCDWTLTIRDREWEAHNEGTVLDSGTLNVAPVVTGLFAPSTSVDATGPTLQATVSTFLHGSTPSAVQWIFTALGSSAAVAVLLLLMTGGSTHRPAGDHRLRFTALDASILGGTLIWALVGPPLLDDGWILQIITHRNPGGQFRNYHDFWDAPLAVGFLHEMLYYLVSRLGESFVLLRLVSVVFVNIGWRVVRTSTRTLVPDSARLAWFAGAALTATFAFAWMISLRAESLVAMLSVISLAAAVRFRATSDGRWLALAAVCSGVGATVHPSGIVVAAPLLVVLPDVVHYVRAGRRQLLLTLAALLTGASVLMLLLFADTDARLWNDNRLLLATAPVFDTSWRSEAQRYVWLFSGVYDTVLRRLSVLAVATTILLLVLRLGRRTLHVSTLPTSSLGVALILLLATPSKWPWHFGSIGLLAVAALTTEVYALTRLGRLELNHIFAVGAFIGIATVGWNSSETWTVYGATYGRSGFLQVANILRSPLVWSAAIALLALVYRRRSGSLSGSLARASCLLPALVLGTAVTSTGARFIAATIGDDTSSGRQNIDFLLGGEPCGLGPRLMVDFSVDSTSAPDIDATSPDPAYGDLFPLADGDDAAYEIGPRPKWVRRVTGTRINSDSDIGWVATPWQAIPTGVEGLFVGVIGRVGAGNDIVLQRGIAESGRIDVLSETALDVHHQDGQWERISMGRWTTNPGTVARLILRDREGGALGWLAVSDITSGATTDIQTIASSGATVLVDPFLRTNFPCIAEPPLDNGIAVEPDLVIGAVPTMEYTAPHHIGDVRTATTVQGTLEGAPFAAVTTYQRRGAWEEIPVGAPDSAQSLTGPR